MARSSLQIAWPLQDEPPPAAPPPRAPRPVHRGWTLGPVGFAWAAALADAAAILVAAIVTSLARIELVGAPAGALRTGLDIGLVVAVLVCLAELHKGGYVPARYADASGQLARAFPLWNLTALAAMALGVAARAIADYPRSGLALFYVTGLLGLVLARRGVVAALARLHAHARVGRRRVATLGFESAIEALGIDGGLGEEGADLVCRFALRESETFFFDDLALAVAAIRLHRPDEIFLALPWSRPELIENALAALAKLPTPVHLALGRPLVGIARAEVARVGALSGLTMTNRPLGRLQQAEKRALDLVVAGVALVALSPLFALVALSIRLDGPGPVLFRQKRYGLNMEPFRIFKFRTMRAMDDGRIVKQATRTDARITRVGAVLRRLSIDELPQLLNVLIGDMSIVGPRPHALAHDQLYVEKLARYARRHNVKPGITGWAQVHGHRGEIVYDSAMLARLEHDLWYVDNWSMWLDVKVMFMTAFSRRAHANAY